MIREAIIRKIVELELAGHSLLEERVQNAERAPSCVRSERVWVLGDGARLRWRQCPRRWALS